MSLDVFLAGSLGALSVFLLGVLREYLRRRRELRGIARLIDMEIRHNEMGLKSLYNQPELVLTDTINTIRLETWDATRVKIAELMPYYYFGQLAFYYLFLQELKHMAIARHAFHDPANLVEELLKQVQKQEADAAKAAWKYSNMKPLYGFRSDPTDPYHPDNR
jgi:hypothetical protein